MMNTLSKLVMGFVAAGSLSLIGGCTKAHEPEPLTPQNTAEVSLPPTMTPAARTRTAAEQIAQARCEREQQCGNIGNDQTYSSSQECLVRIRADWKEELNARDCPGGVNEKELHDCLAQVRGEACSNPFDTLARVTECTSGQICVTKR